MQYIVKAGDTLYGISNQYGVSVKDIISINPNINPNNLQINQIIKIPSNIGTNPDNVINYIVKKGDTLYGIANAFGITVPKIKELNNLTTNNLSIGQVLKIPEKYQEVTQNAPQYINYVVKKGDTLYKIATANNISVDILISDNGLTNNNLSIGQVLKIRTQDNEIEECFGESYTPTQDTIYTVKKGDSLYSIAKKFNTSVESIKNKNNLKTNLLQINQVLKI